MTELLYLPGKTGSKTAGISLPLGGGCFCFAAPQVQSVFCPLSASWWIYCAFLCHCTCCNTSFPHTAQSTMPQWVWAGWGRACGLCCNVDWLGGRSLLLGSAPFRLLPHYMCAKAIKIAFKMNHSDFLFLVSLCDDNLETVKQPDKKRL